MRRTVCLVALAVVATTLSLSIAAPASAGDVPTVMQLSPSEENVTAGDGFQVDLVLTSDGGPYGDVEVESVEATLSYGEGVQAEDVGHGSWFEGGDVDPERSHSIDTREREVRVRQSLKSGDTGSVETYATVDFTSDAGFEGRVPLEVSELNVTLTDGREIQAVSHSDSVKVRAAEGGGLPMPGFGFVASVAASLSLAYRRLRVKRRGRSR